MSQKTSKLSDKQKVVLNAMLDGSILYLRDNSGLRGEYSINREVVCYEKTTFSLLLAGLISNVGDFRYKITEKGRRAIQNPPIYMRRKNSLTLAYEQI